MTPNPHPQQVTHALDGAAISVLLASIAGWLPAVASLVTIVWMGIRIWETKTVQGWFARRGSKP